MTTVTGKVDDVFINVDAFLKILEGVKQPGSQSCHGNHAATNLLR